MMKNSLRMSLLILSFTFSASFAQAAMSGIFMVVKGDVKVFSKSGKMEVAKIGTKVVEGDTVQSGHDSRAKIVMEDRNVFNISPDSKMVIEKYQNDNKGKNVELKVEFGKVRASVEQKYDGDKSQFNVKTPTAVAGVRGTDFVTSYDPVKRLSSIVTFSGMVAVGKAGVNGNSVYVPPGHMTEVGEGKSPEAPKMLPPTELKQMNQETTAAATKPNAPASPSPASTASNSSTSGTGSGSTTSSASPTQAPAPSSTAGATTGSGAATPPPAPSMIGASDLGPDAAPVMSGTRAPASVAPQISGCGAACPQPATTGPSNSFINSVIKNNQPSHLTISIHP